MVTLGQSCFCCDKTLNISVTAIQVVLGCSAAARLRRLSSACIAGSLGSWLRLDIVRHALSRSQSFFFSPLLVVTDEFTKHLNVFYFVLSADNLFIWELVLASELSAIWTSPRTIKGNIWPQLQMIHIFKVSICALAEWSSQLAYFLPSLGAYIKSSRIHT